MQEATITEVRVFDRGLNSQTQIIFKSNSRPSQLMNTILPFKPSEEMLEKLKECKIKVSIRE